MGRMWNDTGATFGGASTPIPSQLDGFDALTPAQQRSLIANTVVQNTYRSARFLRATEHSSLPRIRVYR
jgi:hypothetical protein